MHQARLERVFRVQPAGDRGFPALSVLRGAAVRHFHSGDAQHPSSGDMERRNGYRAAEEGGGAMGEKVALEKHPVGLRQVLNRLVLTFRSAYA